MITAIETAVLDLVKASFDSIRAGAIQKGQAGLYAAPTVSVAIFEGSFKPEGRGWRQSVSVVLLVSFKNIRSEEGRRKGINPIVQGMVSLLGGKDLGLKIRELNPERWKDVTDAEDEKAGEIVYTLQFGTSFLVERVDPEAATAPDLLSIGLKYYLKPGDDQVDAEDQITLQGGTT